MNKNTSKTLPPDDICPYCALENNIECSIIKGGMYIPMPEHVKMFCHSSQYYKCQKFIQGCELIKSQDEFDLNDFLDSRDRRRMRRYPEQLYLDLVVSGDSDMMGPQLMKAYKAKSLDVSLAGLRMESFKEFPKDAYVSFVMDPDFSTDSLLGVGEVKWCVPKPDSNKFESGIEFSNYSTSESMREFLEM